MQEKIKTGDLWVSAQKNRINATPIGVDSDVIPLRRACLLLESIGGRSNTFLILKIIFDPQSDSPNLVFHPFDQINQICRLKKIMLRFKNLLRMKKSFQDQKIF